MIKNKVTQLVFQTGYCVLAVIGFLNSLGYFSANFNENFYVYYTNLSNYICMFVMFVTLVKTYKVANRKEDSYCDTLPTFNFLCVILIMVTFLIYNILLSNEYTLIGYFTSLSNMLMHVILPIMFILNWLLFYEHNFLKWYHPLLSTIMPIVYVVFITVRAIVLSDSKNALLYPYFFLNFSKLGWGGFFAWVLILLLIFIVIGYGILIIEKNIFAKKDE